MPRCITICDLRTASAAREITDFDIFCAWLGLHSLFAYGVNNSLVNIIIRFVVDKEVNAEKASVVG